MPTWACHNGKTCLRVRLGWSGQSRRMIKWGEERSASTCFKGVVLFFYGEVYSAALRFQGGGAQLPWNQHCCFRHGRPHDNRALALNAAVHIASNTVCDVYLVMENRTLWMSLNQPELRVLTRHSGTVLLTVSQLNCACEQDSLRQSARHFYPKDLMLVDHEDILRLSHCANHWRKPVKMVLGALKSTCSAAAEINDMFRRVVTIEDHVDSHHCHRCTCRGVVS